MSGAYRFCQWRIGGPLGDLVDLVTEKRGGAGRARFIGPGAPRQQFDDAQLAHDYALSHGYTPEIGRREETPR